MTTDMNEPTTDYMDRLLLIFIHGFKGDDTSFKDFPARVQTILTNTVKADVNAIIYPRYKTAGDLKIAVENFSSWLTDQVTELQQYMDKLNSKGKIMVVLLGHSMGGIVAAETILKFHDNEEQLLGAHILGMIAFDTPFFSISPNFIAEKARYGAEGAMGFRSLISTAAAATVTATSASKAVAMKAITAGPSSATKAGTTLLTGSPAKKWGVIAGVVGSVAVGAAAYMAREKIQATVTDAFDHLTFISDLTDMKGLNSRVRRVLEIPDIFFRCFYVELNKVGRNFKPKTFINLPPEDVAQHFVPVHSMASNEIKGHLGMFDPKKTNQYYDLGSDTIALVSEMVARFQRKNGFLAITAAEDNDTNEEDTTENTKGNENIHENRNVSIDEDDATERKKNSNDTVDQLEERIRSMEIDATDIKGDAASPGSLSSSSSSYFDPKH